MLPNHMNGFRGEGLTKNPSYAADSSSDFYKTASSNNIDSNYQSNAQNMLPPHLQTGYNFSQGVPPMQPNFMQPGFQMDPMMMMGMFSAMQNYMSQSQNQMWRSGQNGPEFNTLQRINIYDSESLDMNNPKKPPPQFNAAPQPSYFPQSYSSPPVMNSYSLMMIEEYFKKKTLEMNDFYAQISGKSLRPQSSASSLHSSTVFQQVGPAESGLPLNYKDRPATTASAVGNFNRNNSHSHRNIDEYREEAPIYNPNRGGENGDYYTERSDSRGPPQNFDNARDLKKNTSCMIDYKSNSTYNSAENHEPIQNERKNQMKGNKSDSSLMKQRSGKSLNLNENSESEFIMNYEFPKNKANLAFEDSFGPIDKSPAYKQKKDFNPYNEEEEDGFNNNNYQNFHENPHDDKPIKFKAGVNFEEMIEEELNKNPSMISEPQASKSAKNKKQFLKSRSKRPLSTSATLNQAVHETETQEGAMMTDNNSNLMNSSKKQNLSIDETEIKGSVDTNSKHTEKKGFCKKEKG